MSEWDSAYEHVLNRPASAEWPDSPHRAHRPRQSMADLTRHIAALDTENRHLRHEVAARIAERDNAQARAEWLVERVRCVRRQRSVWYRCRKWWREVGR